MPVKTGIQIREEGGMGAKEGAFAFSEKDRYPKVYIIYLIRRYAMASGC
jgi:hypothetical protein